MWLYQSFQEFSREAAGGAAAAKDAITPGGTSRLILGGAKGPPVIVAMSGGLPPGYPMLEGRHRQPLPRVPGRIRGRLLAGASGSEEFSSQTLGAWLVPWRVGADHTMVITVKPGTVVVFRINP